MRSEFHRRGLREADHAMLGRVVRGRPRDGGERVGAGDLHDRSAGRLLGDHLPGSQLGQKERSLEVDVEHAVPFRFGHLQKRLHEVDAGIVDEAIDAAEAIHRGLAEPLEIGQL